MYTVRGAGDRYAEPGMTPDAWRSQGDTHTVDGRRLFCVSAGAGDALLLLHAYPTASWGFHRIVPALAERFRVIAPDLLGSGFSDKPPGPVYGIDHLTDLLEGLLRRLGVDRCHILAHAYGVTTAQELMARAIDRARGDRTAAGPGIQSACFVNGGLFAEGTRPTATQRLLLSPLGPAIARFAPMPYSTFRRKIGRAFGTFNPPTEEDFRAIWTLLRTNDGHLTVPYALRYLNERKTRRLRWVGALTAFSGPLCLINGAADPVAGAGVPRIWSEALPAAMLIQLDPRVGHYPPLEDPAGVLDGYARFSEESAIGSAAVVG